MATLREMTVEQVCARIIDYRGKTPPKTASGVRLITAKVVKNGQILPEPAEYIAEDYYNGWMRRGLPQQWDVLITTEAPLGETAILRTGERVALAQRMILLRGDPRIIEQRYLLYALQSPLVQSRIAARATGTTVLGIKQAELRKVILPVPDLKLQRRIASVLGTYDDLLDVNRRRIALLEEMARRLFDEWFVQFRFPGHDLVPSVSARDGRTPKGWPMRRLGELTSLLTRGISPTYDDAATTLVVGQRCIRDQRLSLVPARRQSKLPPSDKIIQPGDVLVNSTGVGTLGRTAQAEQVPAGLTADSHVTILRPAAGLDRDYFGLSLLRLEPTFERLGVGATGQTELNRSRIADLEIALPPSGLQVGFGHHARPLRSLAFRLGQQNEVLAASRDLLLPRLISGELSVAAAEREQVAAA
jgi:type I restriction enzyme S subunit